MPSACSKLIKLSLVGLKNIFAANVGSWQLLSFIISLIVRQGAELKGEAGDGFVRVYSGSERARFCLVW